MKMKREILFMLLFLILCGNVLAQIPKPESVLGFKIGEDRKVADMHQIVDYFNKLDITSERVMVKEVGKTTKGNPFIVGVITSEENQKKLEKYKRYQQLLADPRKITDKDAEQIILDGKTIVMINCSLHASEIGASQMAMELAYDLASKNDWKTKEILDNVILLLVPMHNPDGTQMVVDWYKKNLGTKYEGGRMPWLYHKYVGHDNNRDWYMFTQVESRLTIEGIHNVWHPQIIVDMHQMGSTGARIFVPPFVDPYEPNIDPVLQQEVAMMGTFMALQMTAEGKAGVHHSSGYDAWTPGRAYHHYHGGIRILTEVASIKLATPIEVKPEELRQNVTQRTVKMAMPWEGGKWTLRDIVDYDYSAAHAVLTNAARLRENWLRNFYTIHKNAVSEKDAPFAYIIPKNQKDFSTALKMMNVLQIGGVEIHKAEESFSADGSKYSEGTFFIKIAQPYGGFAKTLLEEQEYPEIREYPGAPLKRPYDVVAHTLPLLMGVDVVEVESQFTVQASLLMQFKKPEGAIDKLYKPFGYKWSHNTNDDIVALNRLINKGYKVYWTSEQFKVNGITNPPGMMIVEDKNGLQDDLTAIIKDLCVHFKGLKDKPEMKAYALKPVRLGLYKSWTASMDEGWTRWVLEQYEFAYESIYDRDIRSGNLHEKFDVIIFTDISDNAIVEGISDEVIPPEYAGGIGEIGVKNIKDFVAKGGCLITLNNASEFPIKRFYLSIENSVQELDSRKFFIPGSILKAIINPDHPVAYGYDREGAVFFRRSPVFSVREGKSVVKYPVHNPLLSGWITGDDYLDNKSAIVDIPYEKGKVILLGFPLLYRGQAHATFRFLFNSIYYGAAKLTEM